MSEARKKKTLLILLVAVCALVVLADFFHDKHGHYAWEGWFGFHAWFGFVTFFFIILAGRWLRRLLMRDEDYYDR